MSPDPHMRRRWSAHNISQRDFQQVIKRAGLRRVRLHDLRHAHCSHLAHAGVPMKVAQEPLGHASPLFTMRVCTPWRVSRRQLLGVSRSLCWERATNALRPPAELDHTR